MVTPAPVVIALAELRFVSLVLPLLLFVKLFLLVGAFLSLALDLPT
jgi:hypothetical protein